VVDSLGIPATLWLGGALALASLAVIASFGFNNKNLAETLSQ
jgi:hypothetical protein